MQVKNLYVLFHIWHSVTERKKKLDDFENESNVADEEEQPPTVIPSKTELHAIKFKMQVPTSAAK